MRNFLLSGVMLFLVFNYIVTGSVDKKRITLSDTISSQDFFIPNQELNQIKDSEEKISSKKLKKNKKTESDLQGARGFFVDIPQCIDSYNIVFNNFPHETRCEFYTKQLFNDLQQLYLTELIRLGWNVELFSVLKESIILAQKPSKKILIIIDMAKGGWFSQDTCKIVIIKKEQ